MLGATSRWELLAMLGGFGAAISGTQAFLLERGQWADAIASWSGTGAGPNSTAVPPLYSYLLPQGGDLPPGIMMAGHDDVSSSGLSPFEAVAGSPVPGRGTVLAAMCGFVVSLFLFYVLLPSALILSSSTVLNLSLLTSDLWARRGAPAVLRRCVALCRSVCVAMERGDQRRRVH